MLDILFINPPSHSQLCYVPIGLSYLLTICRKNNFQADILDFQNLIIKKEISFPKDFFLESERLIKDAKSKTFGISVMNTSYPWAQIIIKQIREHHPYAKIILGGPLVTYFEEDILRENPFVDIAVISEAEEIIVPLLLAILDKNDKELLQIQNVYTRATDNPEHFKFCGKRPLMRDLSPLPKIEFDFEKYNLTTVLNMDVGRGCPYRCYYCSTNILWDYMPRFKSSDVIIQQSQDYFEKIRSKKNALILYDHDNFLSKKKFFTDFVQKKSDLKADFSYGCSGRLDNINYGMIDLLKKSNCKYVFMGIESGSPRIQKLAKKNIDLSNVEKIVGHLLENSIMVDTNYICGFPEETYEEFLMTIKLMSEVSWLGALVNASTMSPEPKTEVAQKTKLNDFIILKNKKFYKDLLSAGITPESLTPQINNHLYTIRNSHYNILEVSLCMHSWRDLLQLFPVSTFLWIKKHKISFEKIFESMLSYSQKQQLDDIEFEHIPNFYRDISERFNFSQIDVDVFNFELAHAEMALRKKSTTMGTKLKHNVSKYYKEMKNNQLGFKYSLETFWKNLDLLEKGQ